MAAQNSFESNYSANRSLSKSLEFDAPAEDDMEMGIDLNEQLIINRPATFFMRVSGNSMINVGIFDGDVLIVDRSIKPANGKIVIAILDGEMLVRRYEQTMNRLRLVPETTKLAPIDVSQFSDLMIWGVVTCVIRMVDNSLVNFDINNRHKRQQAFPAVVGVGTDH
jgi:DNA polymerase V